MVSRNTLKNSIPARWLVLSMILFWDEGVLRYSTMKGDFFPDLLLIAVNAFIFGGLITLLISWIPKKKGIFLAGFIAVTALSVLFLVNDFVYYQFKIFYDINTVTSGADGVLSGFQSQIASLVFSPAGLKRILFLLVPLPAWLVWTRFDSGNSLHLADTRNLCAVISCCLGVSLLHQFSQPDMRRTVDEEYNFQTLVNRSGLLEGLVMDLLHNSLDARNIDFHTGTMEAKPFVRPAEIVYEKNVLDIDFKALAKTAGGTEKTLDTYVASLTPSSQNDYTGLFAGKNLILITAEAFSAEVIDPKRTPTLYRMAEKGIRFTDYYQPASAGTTGGEYEVVFGALPTSGGSSFKKMTARLNYMTMGSQLGRLGYNGWAFHNNTYTFYDRHRTHNALGYSNGFMGIGNGMEKYVTAVWPESDLEMFQGTVPLYIDKEPFNVYYMTVSGHNGYTQGENAMARKHWDRVEGAYSDPVHGYLACNLELEDSMTWLIRTLEEKGIADDTVIVISADHFPYGLDYGASLGNMPYLEELYGYKVNDYLTRDHSRLIIWSGCLEDEEPLTIDSPSSSLDILPTLSNLFGTAYDSRLFAGRDVFSDQEALVFNMNYEWKTDLGTYTNGKFTPASKDTVIPSGYVEKIKNIVKNKIRYCQGYQAVDYFRHVFKP